MKQIHPDGSALDELSVTDGFWTDDTREWLIYAYGPQAIKWDDIYRLEETEPFTSFDAPSWMTGDTTASAACWVDLVQVWDQWIDANEEPSVGAIVAGDRAWKIMWYELIMRPKETPEYAAWTNDGYGDPCFGTLDDLRKAAASLSALVSDDPAWGEMQFGARRLDGYRFPYVTIF